MKRLAVARLWHEGNSFSPVATMAGDFHSREWVVGAGAVAFYRGSATEIGAVVDFIAERADWDAVYLRCAAASPAGPLVEGLYQSIRDEIVEGLAGGPWDAVYLSLHGAMLAAGVANPERDLLAAVRDAIGDAPLGVSFDLHANLDPAVADPVDVAVGYKTYPHTDIDETAAKTLRLLADAVAGKTRPACAIAKAGCVLPSFNMRTAEGPMAEVAALARDLETREGLLDVSAFGGFAYGDVPYAGAAALALADGDVEAARIAAAEVAAAIAERRGQFFITLPTPAEGIARALAEGPGTVAVLDPADNPLSGGVADTPGLFRALIESRPKVAAVFAFFHDPGVVGGAHRLGVGARMSCALGGRLTADFGPPVEVSATVERLTGGRFVNHGPMEANLPVDLGRTAVLNVAGVRVIVTEKCRAANDPAYFDLHGIDLAATRLLCVKAKNHFRAAFGPLCRAIIDVDAPGPACLDLSRLPFEHAPGAR